ncbi:hypothetical protein OCH239_02360 [Roseivivax halodurans JCM 10272]|uniref:HTH lacI-type domain-containing protein n=1 Tax=Roseivivax halodurans JCM 10272 TaxID=1449350 RepID=X7ENJ2_9RHOB|nr:LacI family DNA-binding transcriptional regulator [Roseivivax halodurans]ETX16738.1 hypothetical protein OCH239_02360 [Roseivivax halodurans JCM 10272]
MEIENRVTIRDVARLAGVSKTTVSAVLNGGAGVATKTAERVRTMLVRTGYRRDARALHFRNKRSGPVGIVLTAPPDAPTAALLAGLSGRLREDRLELLLSVEADPALTASRLCGEGVSALVIDGTAASYVPPDCPALFLHSGPDGAMRAGIDAAKALRLAVRAAETAGAGRLIVAGPAPELGETKIPGLPIQSKPWHALDLKVDDFILCTPQIARLMPARIADRRVITLGGTEAPGHVPQICWDGYALGRAVGDAILARLDGMAVARDDIVAPVWLSYPATSSSRSDPR